MQQMIMNDDIEWTNDNESCCRDLTMFRYTCSGTTCNAVNILSFSDGLWGRPRKPRKAHERTYRPSKNVILTRTGTCQVTMYICLMPSYHQESGGEVFPF
ncbi:hypothetical protein ACN38_g4339 [Penicillium nordicum]|uniref:Uncharacterized protein n=1 Tax=Penicillium nordicum TaxID=229535 RepID=A0A0M9WHC8_9EURO|nr:hypothetical protein ACN38_g4339 [Penicillium nordicum]